MVVRGSVSNKYYIRTSYNLQCSFHPPLMCMYRSIGIFIAACHFEKNNPPTALYRNDWRHSKLLRINNIILYINEKKKMKFFFRISMNFIITDKNWYNICIPRIESVSVKFAYKIYNPHAASCRILYCMKNYIIYAWLLSTVEYLHFNKFLLICEICKCTLYISKDHTLYEIQNAKW